MSSSIGTKTILDQKKFDSQRKIISKLEEELEDSQTCSICFVEKKNTALIPCGHLLCAGCTNKIWNSRKCPFCNQMIRDSQKIFL